MRRGGFRGKATGLAGKPQVSFLYSPCLMEPKKTFADFRLPCGAAALRYASVETIQKSMKAKPVCLLLSLLTLLFGCKSTDVIKFDETKRPPTASVDIFHFDSDTPTPSKRYKMIAELNFLGPRQDEKKTRRYFIATAKSLGANAVIMQRPEMLGTSGNNMGISTGFYFKAKAVVYE